MLIEFLSCIFSYNFFKKNPSQDPVSLVDVLLKENGELTKSVTALTDEKLELRAAVSRLEKKLQQHLHRGNGNGQVHIDVYFFGSSQLNIPAGSVKTCNWQSLIKYQ